MASVRVIPVGMLRQYVGGQEALSLEGWAGRSVREMLDALGIPSAVVGGVFVGQQLVQKDYLLQDGDEIRLIALLGGG
ncbi:MAG: MoaD/ThiS family protein [Chloroflexia bacterium]